MGDEDLIVEVEEGLTCDSCGGDILEDELFWTDQNGSTLCEDCLPPDAARVGLKH